MCYDLFDSSPLFEGDLPAPPVKYELIQELESCLDKAVDYNFRADSELHSTTILDFMSKIRQYPNLSIFHNFGTAIKVMLNSAQSVSDSELFQLVCDSYKELSVKDCERIRRAAESKPIELTYIDESVPLPQQMDKFWSSSCNKTNIQKMGTSIALRDIPYVVISGMVIDDELKYAQIKELGNISDVPELSSWVEEADDRIIPHISWSLDKKYDRVIVISNDTDTITRILHYMSDFIANGLKELWVQYGVGETKRMGIYRSTQYMRNLGLTRVRSSSKLTF